MRLLFALLLAFTALLQAFPALAAEVSGYVYFPDGRVAEGATVRAGNASVTADKDGKFVLAHVPEGVVELEVTAKDAPAIRPLVLAGDVVTLTLVEAERSPQPVASGVKGEGTVSGKVTVDGKPLANAPVLISGMRVLTNAKGEYVVKGLPAGQHMVSVDDRLFPRLRSPFAGRMYAEGTEPYLADLRERRSAVIDLPMRSAPMVRGRVVDAEGKPVARARVQIVIANRAVLDFALDPNVTRTTPEGRFAFPVPEWESTEQVALEVTPLLQSTVRSKPFTLGNADHDIDITLPKMETVRIRVLDRAGKPVPGARVAYVTSQDSAAPELLLYAVEYGPTAATADANGEVVAQLARESYDFAATAKGFQTATVTKSITKPATVDVTLERAAVLRGRVHRGDVGVASVHVQVMNERARRASASTDADGRFELLGLSPGEYRVVVFKQEELIDRTVTVEAPGEIDIALPPAGTLRGRVVDAATGDPIREFAATVDPIQPPSSSTVNSGYANADGTFTVTVPAGLYRITVGAQNYASSQPVDARVHENETTTVDIPLGRGATIHGRVTDDGGMPVSGAEVMVMAADFERMRRAARVGPSHTQTAADGTFTATGIEPGEVQLTVRKPGFVLYRKNVEAEGTMAVDVTLSRGLSLRGVVVRGGRAVAGAQVSASSPAVGSEPQSTVTDDEGRFTLGGLVTGRYTLSAFLEEAHGELRDVDPAKDRDVVVSLDAKARGVIFGIVTGIPPATGKYTRRIVTAYNDDGSAEGMIDDAGNYRIENAPTGKVSISALVEASGRVSRASTRREVEVPPGQSMRVDIDLGGDIRVSGRVTVDGKSVAAEVSFTSETAASTTPTREDGSYELALPSPGRYYIYARAEQFQDRHYTTIRDIRGSETIDIDLREQVLEGTVVDARTRQPVEGAMVTLSPAGMPTIIAEVQTDSTGRFRVATAIAGALRMVVSAPGYAQSTAVVSGSTTSYSFELGPAAELRVRVVDGKTGAPLDAHVIVSDDNGVITMRPRRSADGATLLFSLAPGKYHVMAIVQGYSPKTVDAEASGAVDIVLE